MISFLWNILQKTNKYPTEMAVIWKICFEKGNIIQKKRNYTPFIRMVDLIK